jgi:hypothetical protein
MDIIVDWLVCFVYGSMFQLLPMRHYKKWLVHNAHFQHLPCHHVKVIEMCYCLWNHHMFESLSHNCFWTKHGWAYVNNLPNQIWHDYRTINLQNWHLCSFFECRFVKSVYHDLPCNKKNIEMNISQFLNLGVNGLLKGLCKMGHALNSGFKWSLGIMK